MKLRDICRCTVLLVASACDIRTVPPSSGGAAPRSPVLTAAPASSHQVLQSPPPAPPSSPPAQTGPLLAAGDGGGWMWIAGSDRGNDLGEYGSKGIAGTTTRPPTRMWAASWIDPRGNFWLFGGWGYDDLW